MYCNFFPSLRHNASWLLLFLPCRNNYSIRTIFLSLIPTSASVTASKGNSMGNNFLFYHSQWSCDSQGNKMCSVWNFQALNSLDTYWKPWLLTNISADNDASEMKNACLTTAILMMTMTTTNVSLVIKTDRISLFAALGSPIISKVNIN